MPRRPVRRHLARCRWRPGPARPERARPAARVLRGRCRPSIATGAPTTRRWRSSRPRAPRSGTGSSTTGRTSGRSASPRRRRGGGAGARPHAQRTRVALGDPRAPGRARGPSNRPASHSAWCPTPAGRSRPCCGESGVCQVGPGAGVEVRCVVDSHVVGVAKPDPAIFEHAAVHFPGVERSRIAYVGDSVTMDVSEAPELPASIRCSSTPTTTTATATSTASGRSLTSCPDPSECLTPSECQGPGKSSSSTRTGSNTRMVQAAVRRRAITLRHRVSSAPSKIDSTRASTNRRLTEYSSA